MAMPGAGDVDWPELAYDSEPYEPLTPDSEKENTMPDPFGLMGAITDAADRETKRQEQEKNDGPIYPDVICELLDQDGNAFNLLAIVNRGLKSYGIDKDERDAFMAEAMAGDYDHLLRTCMKWVTVE